jgi:hypothetical protein
VKGPIHLTRTHSQVAREPFQADAVREVFKESKTAANQMLSKARVQRSPAGRPTRIDRCFVGGCAHKSSSNHLLEIHGATQLSGSKAMRAPALVFRCGNTHNSHIIQLLESVGAFGADHYMGRNGTGACPRIETHRPRTSIYAWSYETFH